MPDAHAVPKMAVAPGAAPEWVASAIVEGGGRVVPVHEADGLVWTSPGRAEELIDAVSAAPRLEWVQLPWAGVDMFTEVKVFERVGRDLQWACAKGFYAEPVAEHALALMLAGVRHLHERARATAWGAEAAESLYDSAVTIVGGGGITRALLGLLAPFRCDVTVVRRSPEAVPGAARTVTTTDLDKVLGVGTVVLALSLTPDTRQIIAAPQLAEMSRRTWLVNVARGAHVDTGALVQALREGRIAGAALDVTDPEPLPDGHPLWTLPNALITPHTANTSMQARPILTRLVRENVSRYRHGLPLQGLVDPALGY